MHGSTLQDQEKHIYSCDEKTLMAHACVVQWYLSLCRQGMHA
jgi:hypothetical protein